MINVLRGDMSLVGPRPPLPDEVAQYDDYERLRLVVTPGLTCLWQISDNRNDIPFEEWVEMDIDYIEHRTAVGDMVIMFKTAMAMIGKRGTVGRTKASACTGKNKHAAVRLMLSRRFYPSLNCYRIKLLSELRVYTYRGCPYRAVRWDLNFMLKSPLKEAAE